MLSHNDDAAIKITDFGFAAVCTSDKCLRNPCGTPQYVAPEVLQGLPYGFPVDIWAIGVVAYILLAGYPPFYHDDDAKLFKIIMRGKFVFHEETWGVVSAQAKNFITCMLNPDPTARHTARQLLNHPWVRNACLCNHMMLLPVFTGMFILCWVSLHICDVGTWGSPPRQPDQQTHPIWTTNYLLKWKGRGEQHPTSSYCTH